MTGRVTKEANIFDCSKDRKLKIDVIAHVLKGHAPNEEDLKLSSLKSHVIPLGFDFK